MLTAGISFLPRPILGKAWNVPQFSHPLSHSILAIICYSELAGSFYLPILEGRYFGPSAEQGALHWVYVIFIYIPQTLLNSNPDSPPIQRSTAFERVNCAEALFSLP